MKLQRTIFTKTHAIGYPNYWDIAALILVFAIIVLFTIGARQMSAVYHIGETIPISLNPEHLPNYALRTIMRMFIAMFISLLFTFVFGTLAAKSKHAERIIIPMVDILQSVPILGFLAISVPAFIALFPNSILGPECAAIFAIFTSQAWNMLMGFYQSLRTVPLELKEVADMYHLSPWQRYWRVEVPMTIPSLLWNMMLSMSAGWFFVVASEAITVANKTIMLPGVGSYIAVAIQQKDVHAIFYAIIAMLIVILLYDQLIFRPLIAWSEKFKADVGEDDVEPESWLVDLLRKTRWMRKIGEGLLQLRDTLVNLNLLQYKPQTAYSKPVNKHMYVTLLAAWYLALFIAIGFSAWIFINFVLETLRWNEVLHVFGLGIYTAIRVTILITLASLIWVPVGVWVGMRPRARALIQPVAQFLAAFPANLLFPLVVIVILKFHLNVEIWTSPLMVLGTQWYILFNVIAGATTLPKELNQVSNLFGVKKWLRWRTMILPAIFPYFITGAMTAAGGAWNASIVAEVVSWGDVTLRATGLGAYITEATTAGHTAQTALGIVVMCIFVLLINRLLWKPLYALAEERFHIE
ncbi:MAG: ABC transporter permease [Gammaproteobacteria bacterium]